MSGMSSFDVAAIVSELKKVIVGARIRNIYQVGDVFLVKLRGMGETLQLLVEPGRRIHLTWYERAKPRFPSVFCMTLRKHLRHGKVLSVWQYDFDRVVVLEVGVAENKVSLVFELFGEGNIVLVDREGKIVVAKNYASMRDRDVLPKKQYVFPPLRGLNPCTVSLEEFKKHILESERSVAATLVQKFNIGGVLAEEVCVRAGIDKSREAEALSEGEAEALFKALTDLLKGVIEGRGEPAIGFRDGNAFTVSPVPLKAYGEIRWQRFESFNKAADEFYSREEEEGLEEKETVKARREEDKLQRMLDAQRKALMEMERAERKHRKYGDLIYKNLHLIDQLLNVILSARKKNFSWGEIKEKLLSVKGKEEVANVFVDVDPHVGRVFVELEGERIPLDITLSAVENANKFYEKAKKAAVKAEGARKAMEETLRRIKSGEEVRVEVKKRRIWRRRERKWYEAYRWFISSDGLLVLGGRDAKSNIALYRRMEMKDVFLHAEVHGAPVVVVKTGGKPCPEATLREAAQFAVSYSRAWREGMLQADAYWVPPEQVSMTPPSGEYLPRGGLIVRGERNYFRNVPLELSVGVIFEEDEAVVMCGPPSAISSKTNIYVRIKPGDMPSSKLAEKIKRKLAGKAPPDKSEMILQIPLEEIQNVLPPGGGTIIEE